MSSHSSEPIPSPPLAPVAPSSRSKPYSAPLKKVINKENDMSNVKDATKPHGPIALSNGWTVEVDANVCIGAGPCVGVAPKTFELNDQAKAVILESCSEDDAETILNAARSCPVSARCV